MLRHPGAEVGLVVVVEVVEELAGGVAGVSQPHEIEFTAGPPDDGFDAHVVGQAMRW